MSASNRSDFADENEQRSIYHEAIPGISGIVNINKPPGMTSHDVVARVRRILHTRRVGHAGTLDPLATGVLPICVGQATRIVEYLGELGKAYRATIAFGADTTTYDAEGDIVATAPIADDLTVERITELLQQCTGDILQVPPIYSAIKRNGQKLYELARQGIDVEIAPRPVHIETISIVSWNNPVLVIDVECGPGTYIRSLAHDLGIAAGAYAHLTGLVRARSGSFLLRDSITLENLAESADAHTVEDVMFAADEGVLHLHAMIVGPATGKRIINGLPIACAAVDTEHIMRAYSTTGDFVALLKYDAEHATWLPHKVFLQENGQNMPQE